MAEIAATPGLIAQARIAAPMLRQIAATGCGEEAVKRSLQPLVLVFGVGEAARSAAFWRVYIKALSDVPLEALIGAVEEYPRLADAEFFPKPGPLRALALKHAEPIYQAASRARRAANLKPARPIERGTPEQRKAFAEQVLSSLGPRRMA